MILNRIIKIQKSKGMVSTSLGHTTVVREKKIGLSRSGQNGDSRNILMKVYGAEDSWAAYQLTEFVRIIVR